MDVKKLKEFLSFASKESKKMKAILFIDSLYSVFKYNISVLEFFQFKFFQKNKEERKKWAGTGYMYEYQLQMNPKSKRGILDDKTKFYDVYRKFFVHKMAKIDDLRKDRNLLGLMINNTSKKLVFKLSNGKCGAQVKIINSIRFQKEDMILFMEKNGFDMVEEFIIQHPELNRLSPTAVNTVRIFTQLNNKNEVEILGCRQRISVNSSVDNLAAGNIAAPIDENTGIIDGPAVYSDITKQDEFYHPITHTKIVGFQIPFWLETVALVKYAALHNTNNRSIGWDIVITEKGPGLIEGNHDWCKLLWQLPVKKGLKSLLEKHLN